ncbi:hypothetical protein [Nevskia sp.]|uniref:hypothetical protein n=1 Tax=Nevskia sp. TaxID=1929292 RepID=UPI0025E7B39F|nr:hypothetical protein [Nevskia sp.]
MSYEKLLAELAGVGTELKKAMAAAPMPSGGDMGDDEYEMDDDGKPMVGEDGMKIKKGCMPAGMKKGMKMSKALDVTLANGDKVQAFDGTELVNALLARTEGLHTAFAKSFGVLEGIAKRNGEMETQFGEMKKSLDAIGDAGRGRKSTVHMIGADPEGTEGGKKGLTAGEFMGKSMTALTAGRITGAEATRIEACINRNAPVPPALIDKVLAA